MIRSDLVRHIAVPLVLLAILTVALTWPLSFHLTTHTVDLQDPLLNTWIIAWEAHQLLQAPFDTFDANIFLPYENTLAFSEILLSITLLVAPLRWAGTSPLATYNIAFLLSFFTTALGGYLLALHVTQSRPASVLAGIAFAFSPYRMGHLSQIQLLATGWLPLSLLYLGRTLQNRTTYRRDAALFGVFFVTQALASFYSAFFAAGACLVYVVIWWLVVAQRRIPWRAVGAVMVVTIVAGIVLVPVALPYFEVQETFDAGWSLADNQTFSASLQAYVYAPAQTYVLGPLTERLRYVYGPCCPPDTLFPGVTLSILALISLFYGDDRRRWLFVGLLAVGFLLSLGPTLKVSAGEPTFIRLPYYWLFTYVPGFDALRAPVRWALLVTLGLSILAAWAVAGRPRWAAVALVLVIIEFAVVPMRLVAVPEPAPVVHWLDRQEPTRIVELPLAAKLPRKDVPSDQPRRSWETSRLLEHQYFSTWHWHSTPDGYSGFVPPRHGEFAREMQTFPSERSIALLQSLGVEYVVLHEDEMTPAQVQQIHRRLDTFDSLETVVCFENEEARSHCSVPADRVLRIAERAAEPAPTWSVLNTGPAQAGGDVPIWLTAELDGIRAVPADARFSVQVRWDGSISQENEYEVELPLLLDHAAVIPLPLTAPAQSGEYTLRVEAPGLPGEPAPMQLQTMVQEEGNVSAPAPLAVTLHTTEIDSSVNGDKIMVVLGWQPLQQFAAYYSISVRAVTEDGSVIAQEDGPPGGDIPTIDWHAGQTYQAGWQLNLPADTPVDLYIEVVWYRPDTGTPMLVWYNESWRRTVALR